MKKTKKIGKSGIMRESIELMKDKEFMNSYKKARKEIKKRNFVNIDIWNKTKVAKWKRK